MYWLIKLFINIWLRNNHSWQNTSSLIQQFRISNSINHGSFCRQRNRTMLIIFTRPLGQEQRWFSIRFLMNPPLSLLSSSYTSNQKISKHYRKSHI